MSAKKNAYKEKHGSDVAINSDIKDAILQRAKDDQLPCAIAFDIVKKLNVAPSEVGKTADLINVRLTKCQLGLFGYQSNKKIVKKQANIDSDLARAIHKASDDNGLPCAVVWEIAKDRNTNKMAVSNACETLGIKIRPCQLGAF